MLPKSQETSTDYEDEDGYVRSKDNLFMDGTGIFNFSIEVVPDTINRCLIKNNISVEDIDLFIFHQANKFMLDFLRKKLRIPKDKFYINMEDTGNTVSASIPIALKRAEAEGRISKGAKVMLVGFGVGLSWGSAIIQL